MKKKSCTAITLGLLAGTLGLAAAQDAQTLGKIRELPSREAYHWILDHYTEEVEAVVSDPERLARHRPDLSSELVRLQLGEIQSEGPTAYLRARLSEPCRVYMNAPVPITRESGSMLLDQLARGRFHGCTPQDFRHILASILRRLRGNSDPDLQAAAAFLIGQQRLRDHRALLAELLRSENRLVRRIALEALGRFGDDSRGAIESHIAALGTEIPPDYAQALRLIATGRPEEETAATLAPLLSHHDPELRLFALEALEDLSPAAAAAHVREIDAARRDEVQEIGQRAADLWGFLTGWRPGSNAGQVLGYNSFTGHPAKPPKPPPKADAGAAEAREKPGKTKS